MNECIIFINDGLGVSVINPVIGCGLTVEEIAVKDVPCGKPYKIVDASDIPTDRSMRDLWEVNPEDLTDGIGGVAE